MKKALILVSTLLLAASPLMASPATAEYWLHVRVDETASGGHVRVNLPLSAVEAALPLIPEESLRDGRIQLDLDHEIDFAQLREIWTEIRDIPEATTLVSVEDPDESVLVTRRDDHLLIEVDSHGDRGEEVEVKLPFQVVEALLSGTGEDLDLLAGLRALAEYGEGELVAVNSDQERVRVWIDRSSESN